MKLRLVVAAAILGATFSSCATKQAAEQPSSSPGMWSRMTGVFHGSEKRNAQNNKRLAKDLIFSMELTPQALKLSDDRRLKVVIGLANTTKKFVQLEFPGTQRIEVIVRDKFGKALLQWSEDQAFSDEIGYVAINPGERIQYVALIPTRDMNAGAEYTVEGSVPNYPDFKARKIIVPGP